MKRELPSGDVAPAELLYSIRSNNFALFEACNWFSDEAWSLCKRDKMLSHVDRNLFGGDGSGSKIEAHPFYMSVTGAKILRHPQEKVWLVNPDELAHLLCPISHAFIERPVFFNGHLYDEASLTKWLSTPIDPMTGAAPKSVTMMYLPAVHFLLNCLSQDGLMFHSVPISSIDFARQAVRPDKSWMGKLGRYLAIEDLLCCELTGQIADAVWEGRLVNSNTQKGSPLYARYQLVGHGPRKW